MLFWRRPSRKGFTDIVHIPWRIVQTPLDNSGSWLLDYGEDGHRQEGSAVSRFDDFQPLPRIVTARILTREAAMFT